MEEEHNGQNEMNKSKHIFFEYGDPIFGGPMYYIKIPRGCISLGFILDVLLAISFGVIILFVVMSI